MTNPYLELPYGQRYADDIWVGWHFGTEAIYTFPYRIDDLGGVVTILPIIVARFSGGFDARL